MNLEGVVIDYYTCKECKEPNYGICHKCGKCGRVFEHGFLVDAGGTTTEEDEE